MMACVPGKNQLESSSWFVDKYNIANNEMIAGVKAANTIGSSIK
jgi:hypothetical protein